MKNRLPIMVLLCAALWACQSYRGAAEVQNPFVSLKSLEIARINFSGVDLVAHLAVENPNATSLAMPLVSWKLSIGGTAFSANTVPLRGSIRRNTTTSLDIPIHISYPELYQAFSALKGQREVDQSIAVSLAFPLAGQAEASVIEVEHSAVLPLPQLPVLGTAEMRIERITLSGITMVYEFAVENPNDFPIPFPRIDWTYTLNGAPALSNSVSGSRPIAAHTETPVRITITKTYADVFDLLETAQNSGSVRSNLSLSFDPSALHFPAAETAIQRLDVPGAMPILQRPEVTFRGIRRKSFGMNRLEFTLNWEIENKNSFAFDVGVFNYHVMIGNDLWAKGSMEAPPRVAANGKTNFPIDVVITNPDHVRALVPILSRGDTVHYNSSGNIALLPELQGPSRMDIPFSFEGSIRIRMD